MSNSYSIIRHAIREMILSENYNVSIVGTPIITQKRKRGEKRPEDIVANVVLSSEKLLGFIDQINAQDELNTSASEADDAIMQRIKAIEDRVSPGAAKLALNAYLTIKEDPEILEKMIFNLPDETGAAKIEFPNVGEEYVIPPALQQLALTDKSAGGDENVGKGEALGILMFGREGNAKEPDLIVSTEDVEKQFSVKYFRSRSDTVRFSAGLSDYAEDTENLISLTKKLRDIDGTPDKRIDRTKMRSIISRLMQKYSGDEEGIPAREDIIEMATECGTLWDTLTVSVHPVLCLVGGGGGLRFEVASADPVSPDGIRLGIVRFEGNVPKLELASPEYSRIDVSFGSNKSET